MTPNVAASVRQKLLDLSKQRQENFMGLLTRYALERLLYRLHQSEKCDDFRSASGHHFILKGAMLFTLWSRQPHRATCDLDLLCYGDPSVTHLEQLFQAICQTPVTDDGLDFQAETIKGERIKERQEYEGVRIKLTAVLTGTNTRIPIQVDIGFGDAIVPSVEETQFPVILDRFPAPILRTYPRETVIAEKFQAMVNLGIANSRMKDFYDLWYLSQHFAFQGSLLSQAIQATFERRRTTLPSETPLALTAEFFEDQAKQTQWKAFVRKGQLFGGQDSFANVVTNLQEFLVPPTLALSQAKPFANHWVPGGPWQTQ